MGGSLDYNCAGRNPHTKLHIYTDSRYVFDAVVSIELGTLNFADQTHAHSDLPNKIIQAWQPGKFVIHKVKSHRNLEDARNYQEPLEIQGNNLADKAAVSCRLQDISLHWRIKQYIMNNLAHCPFGTILLTSTRPLMPQFVRLNINLNLHFQEAHHRRMVACQRHVQLES